MSKKTPVKKSRRRLKRSVRRSLAAVLMITAIVVATIPVPENYAVSENDITTPTVTEPKGYQYPTDMADKGIAMGKDDPDLAGKGKTRYESLIITPLSDGTYQLNWQFKFFLIGTEPDQDGIICEYNNKYQQDTVELKANVIYKYDVISGDEYDNWYKDKNRQLKSYICNDAPGTNGEADKFMSTYFADAYQQYCEAYAAYQNSTTDPKAEKPDPLIRYVVAGTFENGGTTEVHEVSESLSESDKLQYYCEQKLMPEYKLAVVVTKLDSGSEDDDSVSEDDAGNKRVYIPKLREGQTKPEFDLIDSNGFKVLNDTTIIGIGDNAFRDTENVSYLTVPQEIKYVGESAFEHSFLKEISFVNTANISNFAFKDCTQLTKITIGAGVQKIGTEAFYRTAINSVVFPATTEEIGPGAFAYCESLQTIDFSQITAPAKIDEYAFYNNVALNSVNMAKADGSVQSDGTPVTVNIDTIGNYAFAIYSGDVGSMTDFVFPNKIATVWKNNGTRKGLGDGVLAGRTKLKNVTMPADFGRSAVTQVPDNTFYGCYNLECVKFPDDKGGSCGYASYTPEKLFASVSNANFYVQGPELDNTQQKNAYAQPRKCTWDAVTAAAKIGEEGKPVPNVPYLYIRDGKKFYEIGSTDYLMCVNEDGILTSCRLKDNVNPTAIDLEIWAQVGTTKVTGIASDCFSDDKMNQKVRTLTIFDDSLSTIDANVFKGWSKLEKVYIGNSVTSIGASAFEGCFSLKDVTFNTPESAAANFTVGENAFRTNGSELTFHGLISQNFAPYTWAMKKDNVIDPERGVRVCYKSLAPSNLTVMYNAKGDEGDEGEITLLDYPKYEQVEELLGEQYATKEGVDWARSGFSSAADYYRNYMENMYYNLYSTELYESKRKAFKDEWDKASDGAAIEALYNDPVLYGPWVNPEFAAIVNTNKGEGGGGTTSASADKGMFDWLFEPLVAQAAPAGTDLQPYYSYSNGKYAYNATENYERDPAKSAGPYQSSTTDELKAFGATKNIVVPDGVTSIDVNGYLENQDNVSNRLTYFTSDRLGSSYDMYTDSHSESEIEEYKYTDHDKDRLAGLFSGLYVDYGTTEDEEVVYEKLKKGNDRVEKIDLNGVTYLPAYAFDSCENLKEVKIGAACTDIGKLPFRGCTSLTDVQIDETNPKYQEDNRIIYSYKNDEAGNTLYKIEECLETRGKGSNSSTLIDSALDSKIINVNEIADGAFESCNYLRKIHMTDAVRLATIPDRAFKSCKDLDNIELPATVNKIDKEAFASSNNLASIRIPGREVFISTEAFKEDDNKRETLIVTYEDSSAKRYADTYAVTYKLYFDKIGDLWEVAFYDMDGTQIGDTFSVEDNTRLTDDKIPEDPVRAGYTFDKWVGTGGVDVRDPITQSTNFIAKYNSNSGMVGDKYVVTFLDGLDGSLLTGEGANRVDGLYYVEAGTSFAENNLQAPEPKTHDGFTFLTWSDNWTVNTVIDDNMPIIALYSENGSTTPAPGGTPGTTPGTSTGTTNNTSNKSTSSSTSSTSTSSSSTSSTSTTSGSSSEKAFYTVTVENGHGSGSYAAGSTVIIAANTPAAGMQFSKWTTESNGVNLASVSMTATTFTMPENNVTVTANYVTASTPTATPVSGTGTTTPARDDGNTRVDITKPGISNKDLATADVNGSTDNFIVKISETDEATQAVSAALLNKYGNLDNILYYAMDISLYDSTGTTKIMDTSGLSIDITIPIPDALITYGGNNMAGAVVNGSQLEDLSEKFTTVNGVPMVTFTATHFSPYTIYVDTGNLVAGELDVTPKTGDPIHPKWFLSIGLACLSVILFIKKDKTRVKVKA